MATRAAPASPGDLGWSSAQGHQGSLRAGVWPWLRSDPGSCVTERAACGRPGGVAHSQGEGGARRTAAEQIDSSHAPSGAQRDCPQQSTQAPVEAGLVTPR